MLVAFSPFLYKQSLHCLAYPIAIFQIVFDGHLWKVESFHALCYIHKSTWKTLLCFREDMEKCRFKCALFTVLCIGNKVIFFFILLNPFLKSEVLIDSQPMKTKWDNKTFQRSKSVAPNENTEITACVSFYCDYFFSLSLSLISIILHIAKWIVKRYNSSKD